MKYMIVILSVVSCVIILILVYFNRLSLEIFELGTILGSLLIFILLKIYIDIIDYIDLIIIKSMIKTIKNKMPIYLNLLRL